LDVIGWGKRQNKQRFKQKTKIGIDYIIEDYLLCFLSTYVVEIIHICFVSNCEAIPGSPSLENKESAFISQAAHLIFPIVYSICLLYCRFQAGPTKNNQSYRISEK
jgi:hypothetical protein